MAILINDVTPRVQYTAGAAQDTFTYSFEIFDDSDIVVDIDGTVQTLTTHYTVTGAGVTGGGTIVLVTPATGGEIVTLYRDVPTQRLTDYQTAGDFLAETVNDDFDRIVALIQQVEEVSGRALALAINDSSGASLVLPSPVANAILGWDVGGTFLENKTASTAITTTPFTLSLIDDADATEFYTTLGITSFIQTLLDDVNAAAAQTTLGLLIGTDVQAQNATLQDIADNGLAATQGSNLIVDGRFDYWFEATSQTTSGYGSDTMHRSVHTGATTKTHSQQGFTLGQTDVPGGPDFFSRTVVTTGSGAGDSASKEFIVEDVRRTANQTMTFSFYGKADAAKNVAVEAIQNFGTGGSPSAEVTAISVSTVALTTSFARHDVQLTVPSIAGKTLGTNGDDYLYIKVWFDAGSTFDARTNSLGNQSGTFDIANVQLEYGDTATDYDYLGPEQELARVNRYFQELTDGANTAVQNNIATGSATTTNATISALRFHQPMRSTPVFSISNVADFHIRYGAAGQTVTSTLSLGLGNSKSGQLSASVATTPLTIGDSITVRTHTTSARAYLDARL